MTRDGGSADTTQTFGGFAAVKGADEAAARYWAGRVAVACDWLQEVRSFRSPTQVPPREADAAPAEPSGG